MPWKPPHTHAPASLRKYLDEELIDVGLEEFPCLAVKGVSGFVLLHVDEDEADVLHHCEDQMLRPIVPVLT